MMHPHMTKLLADARIDEMLTTAERHRLRQLARHQRHQATEPAADHPRDTTRPIPPISDLSTKSQADPGQDFEGQHDNKGQYVKAWRPHGAGAAGRVRTLCDAISRLLGEPTAKENPMGKVSPQTTSEHLDLGGIEGHYGTLDDYTVGFEFAAHDEDPAPLFSGLPDNACQAHHWGVVLDGTLVIRYTNESEDVIEAGEAYYAPPGHLPLFKAGTRLIEFSPSDELDKTMAKVMVNIDAIQAG